MINNIKAGVNERDASVSTFTYTVRKNMIVFLLTNIVRYVVT